MKLNAPSLTSKPLLLIVIGICLGVVATVIVTAFLPHRVSTSIDDKHDVSNSDPTLVSPHGSRRNTNNPNATEAIDLNSFKNQVQIALEQEHSIERVAALYTLVAPLDMPSVKNLLTQSLDSQWKLSTDSRAELQTVLLERLSISNPSSAVAFVLVHGQESSDTSTRLVWLFEAWAASNLAAAVIEAKKLPISMRKFAFEGILQVHVPEPSELLNQTYSDVDLDKDFVQSLLDALDFEKISGPNEVWFAIIDIAEKDLSFELQLEELAKQWYLSSGFEVIEDIRTSMSHYEMKVKLIPDLLRYIATTEPARAFEYTATQLELGLRWDTAPKVIREWAALDPSTAHDAVSNIDPIALRELLQKIAIEAWALKQPEHVLQNLSNFHRETRTHAVMSAIESLTSESPEVAASWVLQLEEDIDQFEAARALVSVWTQHDLDAARNWVQSESAIAKFRHILYQTLATSMVSIDPSGAFELALTLKLASGGIGLEADIVSQIAIEDVELALTLLPKVRNGKSQAFAYEKVGDALIRSGEFEKAASLGIQLDESNHSNYYQYISYIWVNTDPDKLYAMLPDLPNAEARSKAAYALCVLYDGNDSIPIKKVETLDQYLTEKDRETLGPLAPSKDP